MTRPFSNVLRYLRGAVSAKDAGELTDAQLLQSFVDHGDEAAFETLVRRHGPTVLGVCRRVLHQQQDAEDAFQATFLVLARKAASIASQETVGNWLYGVAYRTARKAKVTNARRHHREARAATMPQQEQHADEVWHDLQPVLDQELHRLPAKYRSPIVLCDLEGKTRPEAARQLGWPEGTLSWRLASARTMLAERLSRRGVALSAGSLALLLSQEASASMSAPLVLSTVKAATSSALGQAVAAGLISADVAVLTDRVLRTMFYVKLKIAAAACLALAVLGTGVSVVSFGAFAGSADRVPAADQSADRDGPNRVASADGERNGARPEEPKNTGNVSGAITAISADGTVLTVQTAGARDRRTPPQVTEVKLADATKVEFNGIGKELNRKLRVGDTVAVSLQGGSAGLIQATAAPDVAGTITAVSGDGNGFTLDPSGDGRKEQPKKVEIKITDKTLMLKPATRGGEAQPEKPAVGHTASVWLVDGSMDTAAALDVRKPSPPGERGERPDRTGTTSPAR